MFYPCLVLEQWLWVSRYSCYSVLGLLAAWQTSRQLAVACGSIVMASPAGGFGGKLCGVGQTLYINLVYVMETEHEATAQSVSICIGVGSRGRGGGRPP